MLSPISISPTNAYLQPHSSTCMQPQHSQNGGNVLTHHERTPSVASSCRQSVPLAAGHLVGRPRRELGLQCVLHAAGAPLANLPFVWCLLSSAVCMHRVVAHDGRWPLTTFLVCRCWCPSSRSSWWTTRTLMSPALSRGCTPSEGKPPAAPTPPTSCASACQSELPAWQQHIPCVLPPTLWRSRQLRRPTHMQRCAISRCVGVE